MEWPEGVWSEWVSTAVCGCCLECVGVTGSDVECLGVAGSGLEWPEGVY